MPNSIVKNGLQSSDTYDEVQEAITRVYMGGDDCDMSKSDTTEG